VRQVEQFRELGAHVKKPLPKSVIEASEAESHHEFAALEAPETQAAESEQTEEDTADSERG
jgi:hypothetical protein